MSSLIPIDDMTTLKPAAEVHAVAEDAVAIIEEETVAAAINNAANTGEYMITWSKPLSDKIVAKLKSEGYRVVQNSRAANPDYSWTISF